MDSAPTQDAFLKSSLENLAAEQDKFSLSKAMKAKFVLAQLKEKLQKSEATSIAQEQKNAWLQVLLELDGKVLRGQRAKDGEFDWNKMATEIEDIQLKILGKEKPANFSQIEETQPTKQEEQEPERSSLEERQEEQQIVENVENKEDLKIGSKEMAAIQLLKQGAKFELVQEIVGPEIDLKKLEQNFMKGNEDSDDDRGMLLNLSMDVLARSRSIKEDDKFFKQLMEQIDKDPNKNYVDPIFYNVMVDPVVLSSGVVMNRQTILNDNGTLKYDQCPMTRQQLKRDVYPLNFLKSELRDWLLDRFKKILIIAEKYRDQKEKFEKVCDMAEKALNELGEDTYKNEAKKYAQLLLSSPYLDNPEKFAKCYIRVYKTLSDEEKDKLFKDEISQMKEKARNCFDSQDLEKTLDWLDACDLFNKARLGKVIDTNDIWLDYLKKTVEMNFYDNEEDLKKVKFNIKSYQVKVYQSMAGQPNSEQEMRAFLEREGLAELDMIDMTPIKLVGTNINVHESIEEPQLLHHGTPIDWTCKQIKVNADWTDQGWGNKKARLWLRLYRGDELIHDHDMFGICERNDPNQRERVYEAHEPICNLSLPGDIYKLYGRSGGGGGHQLKVRSVGILLTPVENSDAEPKKYRPNGNLIDPAENADQAANADDHGNIQQLIVDDDDDDDDEAGGLFGDDSDDY